MFRPDRSVAGSRAALKDCEEQGYERVVRFHRPRRAEHSRAGKSYKEAASKYLIEQRKELSKHHDARVSVSGGGDICRIHVSLWPSTDLPRHQTNLGEKPPEITSENSRCQRIAHIPTSRSGGSRGVWGNMWQGHVKGVTCIQVCFAPALSEPRSKPRKY